MRSIVYLVRVIAHFEVSKAARKSGGDSGVSNMAADGV